MKPRNKREGREQDSKFYWGTRCKCGNTKRYTSSGVCVECCRERQRKWRVKHPDYYRNWMREDRKKHPDKYRQRERKRVHRQLLDGQDPPRPAPDRCECCGRTAKDIGETRWNLSLDHDHETKEFRGWLCHVCNSGIGHLGDNLEGLQKAVAYLERAIGNHH